MKYTISELYYVSGLHSAGALLKVERYSLTFVKRLEAFGLDRGKMYKDILSVFTGDKAVALLRVEPLNSSLVHDDPSIKMYK